MESNGFNLIWLVLALPLAGFLLQALAGERIEKALGKRVLGGLAVAPIALAFLIAVVLTQRLAGLPVGDRNVVVWGAEWIRISQLNIPFEVVVDPLSMTMVLIITGIGALIHLYATGYMSEEREYARFFTYLNLFIASMLVLVLGNNLVLLFIGWEGVGLCSYLLIGFWYKDMSNARAANKAFIVNRVGDWSLTLGLFLIIAALATVFPKVAGDRVLSFDTMLPALQSILRDNPALATVIALLLFGGAAGKSAQFPLYVWLPDAMAGPTPVSALIHAATMVTSGVVLLNRMHVVFECSPVASAIVCAIGAFTALFAALIAFGQTDIKKVLAYSTVSQLGFMFIGTGAGAYWTGMFHVTTHAFFKALLFLGAGAVIHAMAHEQDMRRFGKLAKYLPITFATMVVGSLAISGFPLMSGFFSKEALLGAALAGSHAQIEGYAIGQWSGLVGLVVAGLTALYMTRLTFLTFMGNEERWRTAPLEAHVVHHVEPIVDFQALPDPHGFYREIEVVTAKDHDDHGLTADHTPHEVGPSMWIPLVVLAILSVFGGFILHMNGMFEHWLQPTALPILGDVKTEPTNIPLTTYSLVAAFAGMILGGIFYYRGLPVNQGLDETKWTPTRLWQRDQFGFDRGVTTLAVQGGGDVARSIWHWFDTGIIDAVVGGAAKGASGLGDILRQLQTGSVRLYAMVMLAGVVGFLGYFMIASHLAINISGGR